MENIKIRYIILLLIILFASIFVNFFNYDISSHTDGIDIIANIPKNFGQWHGSDVTLEEQIFDILETRAIVHRNYISKKNSKNVFLSIVYYPETKVDFHAPEACLAGKGIQISKIEKTVPLSIKNKHVDLSLNQLIRLEGRYRELIYYFYKSDKFLGNSYIKLRLNLALNKFFSKKKKSGSLIRISTTISDSNQSNAEKRLQLFVEELYPYIINYL